MTFCSMKTLSLAAAVAAMPLMAQPAFAQSDAPARGGVSITIHKGPTYLNTRKVGRPATAATYDLDTRYAPTYNQRNNVSFSRGPLPSTLDVPGY